MAYGGRAYDDDKPWWQDDDDEDDNNNNLEDARDDFDSPEPPQTSKYHTKSSSNPFPSKPSNFHGISHGNTYGVYNKYGSSAYDDNDDDAYCRYTANSNNNKKPSSSSTTKPGKKEHDPYQAIIAKSKSTKNQESTSYNNPYSNNAYDDNYNNDWKKKPKSSPFDTKPMNNTKNIYNINKSNDDTSKQNGSQKSTNNNPSYSYKNHSKSSKVSQGISNPSYRNEIRNKYRNGRINDEYSSKKQRIHRQRPEIHTMEQQQEYKQQLRSQTKDHLDRGLKTAYQSEELASDASERLYYQRKKLENVDKMLHEADQNLDRTEHTLKGMKSIWGGINNYFKKPPEPQPYKRKKDIESKKMNVNNRMMEMEKDIESKTEINKNNVNKVAVCKIAAKDSNLIYVIGQNSFGEFGLNCKKSNDSLLLFNKTNKDKCITAIHSGFYFTIYCDGENKNYWIAGCFNSITNRLSPTLKPILYFKNNNIEIKKVCINAHTDSSDIFWITVDNQLYHQQHDNDPYLVYNLKGVIDVQSSFGYGFALCQYDIIINTVKLIINNWIYKYIPNDLINLIIIFYGATQLYYTDVVKNKWIKMDGFDNRNIIFMSGGASHCLFLDSNGSVWSCGDNSYGQRALSTFDSFEKLIVTEIKYFTKNNIKIMDVKCGNNHNLAIDVDGNIYSWGSNAFGQCGNDTKGDIYTPQKIQYFRKYKIVNIQCGSLHSYAKTDDNKHFLWGYNKRNECTLSSSSYLTVNLPQCINQKIETETNGKMIKSISLGFRNTKIIVQ